MLASAGCQLQYVAPAWGQRAASDPDASDSELDAGPSAVPSTVALTREARLHHLQASHTSRTDTAVYGNDLNLGSGLSDALPAAFYHVSA